MERTIVFITLFIVSLLSLQAYKLQRGIIYVSTKMSWCDAQRYCREHHTDLAIFKDPTQIEALPHSYEMDTTCWIGVHRDKVDSDLWKWSDGEKVTYNFWHKGEPNYINNEFCAVMTRRKLFNYDCEHKFAFLCYDELFLVKEKKTWEEALEHCRNELQTDPTSSNNSLYDLAHLPTTKYPYATSLNQTQQEAWVGLRFLTGPWFWVNGAPLEERLKKTLPVCPAPMMHCGMTSGIALWLLPEDCSKKKFFFCSFNNN